MRFTWTGLLLVPIIACATLAPLLRGEGPVVFTFLVLMIPACFISYASTTFLFLPAPFLLSLWGTPTGRIASVLGFVLGTAVILPVTWLAWATSGPDSGPPAEPFWEFFPRWATDPFMLFFPVGGFLTAGFYWWLGTRRQSRATANATPT